MSETTEAILHQMVGMSDLSALLAAAFSFHQDDALAHALADGSFAADWHASWSDALATEAPADEVEPDPSHADPLTTPMEEDLHQADHERMRAEFSRLFFTPGLEVPVWPYESAFLHRKMQLEDTPNLFLTKATVEVEKLMAKACVRPDNLRTEPCDFCGTELQFLAYLYGRYVEALAQAADQGSGEVGEDDPKKWADLLVSFGKPHVLAWMPEFFAQVAAESRIPEYRVLAQLGVAFAGLLERRLGTLAS